MLTHILMYFITMIALSAGSIAGSYRGGICEYSITKVIIYSFLSFLFIIPIGLNDSFIWYLYGAYFVGFMCCYKDYINDVLSELWTDLDWKMNSLVSICFVLIFFTTTSGMFRSESIALRINENISIEKIESMENYYESYGADNKSHVVNLKSVRIKAESFLSQLSTDNSYISSALEINKNGISLQKIADRSYWIVPFQYQSYFTQKKYGAIKSYILIDGYDEKAEPILIESGKNDVPEFSLELSYGGYFGRNIERKYQNEYLTNTYEKTLFVVDDNYVPHYIFFDTESRVGFSNYVSTGITVLDTLSGEFVKHDQGQSPEWIDYNIPLELTVKLYNDYEEYKNGYFASFGNIFASEIKEFGRRIEVNDQILFFGDVTGINNSNALIYNAIIDLKNLKISLHKTSGAGHSIVHNAMLSSVNVEAKVLTPSYEIKHLLGSNEVWIAPMISDYDYSIKMWSIVDAENYSKSYSGKSLQEAKGKYLLDNELFEESVIIEADIVDL